MGIGRIACQVGRAEQVHRQALADDISEKRVTALNSAQVGRVEDRGSIWIVLGYEGGIAGNIVNGLNTRLGCGKVLRCRIARHIDISIKVQSNALANVVSAAAQIGAEEKNRVDGQRLVSVVTRREGKADGSIRADVVTDGHRQALIGDRLPGHRRQFPQLDGFVPLAGSRDLDQQIAADVFHSNAACPVVTPADDSRVGPGCDEVGGFERTIRAVVVEINARIELPVDHPGVRGQVRLPLLSGSFPLK